MDQAVAHLLPSRSLAAEQEIADVLDAATEWAQGRLPLGEAARVGTLAYGQGRPSPAYTRCVAMLRSPPSDPRRAHLLALVETLLGITHVIRTTQGLFDPPDLSEHAMRSGIVATLKEPKHERQGK